MFYVAKKMTRRTRDEIENGKLLMRRLIIRGLNDYELAKSLEIAVAQVRRDKLAIRKYIAVNVSKITMDDLIGEVREQSREVMRQAWMMFNADSTSEKGKLYSLKLILEAMDKQFRVMTGIGLMEAGEQTGMTQTNVTFSIIQILQEIKKEEEQEQKVIDIK